MKRKSQRQYGFGILSTWHLDFKKFYPDNILRLWENYYPYFHVRGRVNEHTPLILANCCGTYFQLSELAGLS